MLHWPAIWNHHIEDSCGFQWSDVDAVTPEFPQNLHNTSREYFRHHLFGIIKLKFNVKPLFIPQNRQIFAQNGKFFFDRKRLTLRVLKSKLPLIIIVAP